VGLRTGLIDLIKGLLTRSGFELVRKAYVFDWQRDGVKINLDEIQLPVDARESLSPDHPQLKDLQIRYKECDYPVEEELIWTEDRVSPEDMLYFRGHNAYLYQDGRFNRNVIGYLLSYYYIKSIDKYQLLKQLKEDNSFGAITYQIDGKLISRDLLDSILEIYYLDSHLNLFDRQSFSVLDIGAGYGRLAYRMVEAFPNLETYLCADAIAVSSYVADYYVRFRGIDHKTRVLPLDTIKKSLKDQKIDLAVNIHSFSECSLQAIEWWMNIVVGNKIPNLLIVPNSKDDLLTQNRESFSYLVEGAGYELVARGPRYADPKLQKYALNPDYFHLYRYRD
jgi:hypothetical protein